MAPKTVAAKSGQAPFVAHCAELLSPLGSVRSRRMFGGWGLYVDEIFMALIAADRLYLKANDVSVPRFQAAGGEPFSFAKDGAMVSTSYWTVPAEALESPALMAPWARLALQAALTARAAKAPRKSSALRTPSTKSRGRA